MPIVETPVPANSAQNCTQTIDFQATGTGGGVITSNVGVVGTHFRLDDEIIDVCAWNNATKLMTVKRAMFGSAGAAHPAGTVGRMATLSLQTQLRTQVNLASGETGMFYWETYTTAAFQNPDWDYVGGWKSFQLYNGTIFLEPQHDFGNSRVANGHGARTCYSRFKQHAWNFRLRPYLSDGPNVHPTWAPAYEAEPGPGWEQVSEDLQPVRRNNVEYCSGTSLWTRYLVRLVNRPSNWLTLDVWVWNKHTAPADGHVINGALVGGGVESVGRSRAAVTHFWQEMNASEERYHWTKAANIDKVLRVYVKNFTYHEVSGDATAGAGPLSDADIANNIFGRADVRPCGVAYAC
jgi:hypothetical protein